MSVGDYLALWGVGANSYRCEIAGFGALGWGQAAETRRLLLAAADRNTDSMRSVVLAWYHSLAAWLYQAKPWQWAHCWPLALDLSPLPGGHMVRWDNWNHRAALLIWRSFVEISQIALIVSHYQRLVGCMTQLDAHFVVSAGPESLKNVLNLIIEGLCGFFFGDTTYIEDTSNWFHSHISFSGRTGLIFHHKCHIIGPEKC